MTRRFTLPWLALATLLWTVAPAAAQPYGLPTHAVAGGGGTSSAGTYTIVGTIGQVGAGTALALDPYSVTGGFEATIDARTYLPFTDDPLTAGSSLIRVIHLVELRTRIDALRVRFGRNPYPYTDPTITAGSTFVRAQHLLDLRVALADAYVAAGVTPPTFAVPVAIGATITGAAIAELRAAVIAVE